MRSSNRAPRRILLFVITAAALHAGLQIPWAQGHLVHPYTRSVAALTAAALAPFLPRVRHSGIVVRDETYAVQVQNVCNGTDVLILFAAAVLVFPAPLGRKVVGLLGGVLLLSLLNLVRVSGLFLTGRYAPTLFPSAHLYGWQALLVLVTAGIYTGYLRWALSRSSHRPD